MTLVERLRHTAWINSQRFDDDHPLVGELRQASDEITRLTAENERLREALKAAVGALNSVHETDGLLDDELAAYQAARAALEQP